MSGHKLITLSGVNLLNTTTDPQMSIAKLRREVMPPARFPAPQRLRRKRRIEDERRTAPPTTRKYAPSFLHASGLLF